MFNERTAPHDLCQMLGHTPEPERIDETGADVKCGRCGLRWHESRDGESTNIR
ncbi:Uncharacterised protein (plasmid) [Tsukamurella tyrosinosolvens]|uniref:Uncharacterized protein n=1 Tax=Tsukamurella tyrosinosolvens TaxID=57704 RepID=A0A1H4VLS7_TSUTY|nr:hypothetical protein SAMN04489793_3255 [Tsukamurella tyrosinosolvens]VEH90465.1 Uncharacterised protein [Tsukamurella tyrosinosolvens]